MPKFDAKGLLNKGKNLAKDGADKFKNNIAPEVIKNASDVAQKVNEFAKVGANKAIKAKDQAQDAIMQKLDVNNDGSVDINDIIILALKIPGVKIDREKFLRNEFKLHYEESVINEALATNPVTAGIPREDIDKIADDVIQQERYGVLGGEITYLSFKPCCDRLKNSLKDTKLSNLAHVETKEEQEIFDAIVTEVVTE